MIPISQLIRGGSGGRGMMMKLLQSRKQQVFQRQGYGIYNPPPTSSHYQPIAVKIGGPGGSRDGSIGSLGFPPTYNELPVPSGDWRNLYNEKQSKYNKHLIIGVTMFVGTIYVVSQVATFMWSPPPLEDEEGEVGEYCRVPVVVEVPKKCSK